jgi:hypothetical protein
MFTRSILPLAKRDPIRAVAKKNFTTFRGNRPLKHSATAFTLAAGLGAILSTQSASTPRSTYHVNKAQLHGQVQPASSMYSFNPLIDFPLNNKILLTENIPLDDSNSRFLQLDSMHGVGGAVSLSFNTKKWNQPDDYVLPTWQSSQLALDGSQSPDRPLRLAVSSSGLHKGLVSQLNVHGTSYMFWNRSDLHNFATKGEDLTNFTGEDAISFGHCGADSDTRFEYVPVNRQHPELIEKLFASLEIEDQIERLRHLQNGKKFFKDFPPVGFALLNSLQEPLSQRASLATIFINDTNPERIQFRKKYIEENPHIASQLLSDDQLRQIRAQLRDPLYENMFLNTTLPLPVVTPAHSRSAREQDQYNDDNFQVSSLTTRDVFGTMGKEAPLMEAAVIGVSDGVGGMQSYGVRNNTKEMSHLLMRSVRHNLTSDTKTTARDLLGQAFTSVLRHNQIDIGACTASIGVLRPAEPEEPEDEYDDGRRLHLSVANLGDSTVFAFRPKHNHDLGTLSYVPIAMAWPTSHEGTGPQRPPLQLTIFEYQDRPNLQTDPNAINDQGTVLSTSHFSTPNKPNSGPSGGANIFTSRLDYHKILAGKLPLSDFFDHLNPTPPQASAINRFSETPGDQPWMAQSFEGVTLRRGDIVCAMSDGITDNLLSNKLTTPAEIWEAVVSYLHPAIRSQHPATRNVRPLRQIPNNKLDHLSGALLCKYNKVRTSDILNMTETILSKVKDDKIPPYDSEGSSKRFVSLRPLPARETAIILDQSNPATAPLLTEKPIGVPPFTEHDNELLYKYNYISTQGVQYHSTLSADAEAVVAGTLSTAMAGSLVRYSQRGSKLDDMSAVVAVVY